MESKRPAKNRGGNLPTRPHKREEYAASSKLAGAGANIARSAAEPVAATPREPEARRQGSRDGPHTARSSMPAIPAGGISLGGQKRSPSANEAFEAAPKDAVDDFGSLQQQHHVDPFELARGGEALLRRLEDVSSANTDLRRQLETQAKEVSMLEEAGRNQQALLRQFQAQHGQLPDGSSVEGRIAEIESRVRTELEAQISQANADRESLLEQLRKNEGECRIREGERDEARERVRQLEQKLEAAAGAPEALETRSSALEMELGLVRARFDKESEARKAAERTAAAHKAELDKLKASMNQSNLEARQLRKALAAQSEATEFQKEITNDLKTRMKEQQAAADYRLIREKGKFEAVNRLESILPRHFLMGALTQA